MALPSYNRAPFELGRRNPSTGKEIRAYYDTSLLPKGKRVWLTDKPVVFSNWRASRPYG